MNIVTVSTVNMFKLADLSKVELLVFISLVDRVNLNPMDSHIGEGIVLNASIKRQISNKLYISSSTVNNSLTRLVKLGFLLLFVYMSNWS